MMKVDEIKLRVSKFANRLIDNAIPKRDFLMNLGNATCKFYVEQNIYKLDTWLKPFEDQQGEIDTERFLYLLSSQVFEDDKITIDIQQYIPKQLTNILPSQLVVTKEDIIRMLK